MGRKRSQGHPQKTSNNIKEDMVESEGDESPVTDLRKMMIRMFSKLKEDLKENIQKQINEYQENIKKKLENTQKQLNELREDFNKLQNETKEIIFKKEMYEIKAAPDKKEDYKRYGNLQKKKRIKQISWK
jgi:hypothetical protein